MDRHFHGATQDIIRNARQSEGCIGWIPPPESLPRHSGGLEVGFGSERRTQDARTSKERRVPLVVLIRIPCILYPNSKKIHFSQKNCKKILFWPRGVLILLLQYNFFGRICGDGCIAKRDFCGINIMSNCILNLVPMKQN